MLTFCFDYSRVDPGGQLGAVAPHDKSGASKYKKNAPLLHPKKLNKTTTCWHLPFQTAPHELEAGSALVTTSSFEGQMWSTQFEFNILIIFMYP